ncbi:FMN-binding negative transcriptional regulator [Deminuibacter soli]|uniref:FMN-binding negative transcriptional regulator n=1 Tax=Deminuibacter soli TaxID=2291815 RepID=A0A3E1NLL0_9BACT|nr:FMN-binding negative transcriptional regulator [Deminuibacter soli]RFM28816.1 FMN-binding negative transcriptional regulator [Deminuibacter soli]
MYHLPEYKENNEGVLLPFMRQYPFVLLCGSNAAGEPVVSHVPVLIKARGGRIYLQGHMMRKTDHHIAFEQNPAALAVFNGPHTYVSASWYSNPQVGSTWNYMAVHARGQMRFLEQAQLLHILEETTALFENNAGSPALFKHLPNEYVQRMTKAIVAFEIEVANLDGIFKLSQNRDTASYDNIIQHLQAQGGDAAAIAAEMEQRRNKVAGV